jgi:hypothetical protein
MFFGVSPGRSWAYVSELLSSKLPSHAFSVAEGRGLGCAIWRAGRLFSIHVRYRLSICNMSFQKRCASWGTKTFLSQQVVIADHTAAVEDITNGAISAVRVIVTVTIDQRADFDNRKATHLSSSLTLVRACAGIRRLRDVSRSLSTAAGSTQAIAIAARTIRMSGA